MGVEERICCFCSDFIENETNVFLNCPFYDDFRENLFINCLKRYNVDFMSFNNEEKIILSSLIYNLTIVSSSAEVNNQSIVIAVL